MRTTRNQLPLKVITNTSPHTARVADLMKAIWKKIPNADRMVMLEGIARSPERMVVIEIDCDWKHSIGTNGLFVPGRGVIAIDGGYVNAADDRHISSVLAHELGHLRGNSDPNGPDLSEETANRFQQEVWRFPVGEVFFKCEVCRFMEWILHREGIVGEVLWSLMWFSFVYVPPTKRLELEECNYVLLDDHPWTSTKTLLLGEADFEDLSRDARRRNARHLKRTNRYKTWQDALIDMARRHLPHEQD